MGRTLLLGKLPVVASLNCACSRVVVLADALSTLVRYCKNSVILEGNAYKQKPLPSNPRFVSETHSDASNMVATRALESGELVVGEGSS